MQIRIQGLYLLFINIFIIGSFIFYILPGLDLEIINHNIDKNIEANVYVYTEVDIKEEWSEK